MNEYAPATMTLDDLVDELGLPVPALRMDLPVLVLNTGDAPWLSTLAGAQVVDGALILIAHEDVRPATDAELAVRDDVIGAP